MASSSSATESSLPFSSSERRRKRYHVFISFRGEDTRNNFISHLHAALRRKSIETYIDDRLHRGDVISEALIKAIEDSYVSLIVFSENYASSKWCLDELTEIVECKRLEEQVVIPVFYKIDPSHVRKQLGSYESALAGHEKDLEHDKDKVLKWKTALTEAANLAGFDSHNFRLESELVESIVDDVLQILSSMINAQVPSGLVGIHQKVEHIQSLLRNGSTNVCILGIWGMGGVGKTTIADVLFRKLSPHFDGCCFIENVKEELNNRGKLELQNKLLTQILGDQKLYIYTHSIRSTFIEDRLQRRKALVVLDDVTDSQQIEDLIGENEPFGSGSIIIVTTRDKDVLMDKNSVIYYKIEPLDIEQALHLFSLKAFQQDQPKEEFRQISKLIINYAKGLPLALKVMGSLLYSKSHGKWEDTLEKLKKVPNAKIHHVLSLSYEGLDSNEKNIFLDIACCLKGEPKWQVIRLLDSCGFFGEIELRSLENKSLISISDDGIVGMHDLIQKMGQQIVREESIKEPEKRSRLWEHEEIHHVLSLKTSMNFSTESISLDMSKIKDVEISPKIFIGMDKLRLLKFFLPNCDKRSNVHISKGLDGLPPELRSFRWDSFPLKALPQSFCVEMLVQLDLKKSFVEKLWQGEQDLSNLKSLLLSGCKHLLELPHLSKAKNLEEIHLDYCVSLRDVPSYIFSLDHLVALNLSGCIVLRCIRIEHSSSLRWLNLSGCSTLSEFSVTSVKLEYLNLDGTALEELPFSVGGAKNLSFLSLARCKILENLPNNFYNTGLDTCMKITNCPKLGKLPSVFETSSSITSLCLDGCSNLSELPDDLSLLSALNELSVRGSSIETLPASINLISHLRSLNVSHCKKLLSLPELPLLLRELDASGCASLSTLFMQNSFDSQYHRFSARGSEDVGVALPHRYYSQRFEFYGCERLDNSKQGTLLVDAVNRIKNAAYMLSKLRASTTSEPYNQFLQFSKDTDARSFENSCRRLCTSLERHKFPSLFCLRRVESSSVTVKLNGNCCSYCRDHPYAFGIYMSNKEENIDLGFDGRHRICMQHWDEAPVWSYWKLECNDVRLSLPASRVPSWFRYQSTKTTYITINVSPHSNILALVFCIVVTNCLPNAKLCLQNVKCKCYLENEGRRSRSYRSSYSSGFEMHLISDTVFAWYDAYTSGGILETIEESRGNDQSSTYSPKISCQFSITQEGLNYQIKECGMRAIYAFDLESNNPMEHEELSFESSHQSANDNSQHEAPASVVSPSIPDIATEKERHRKRYDVIISFRGKDTYVNFTSHLHAALCRRKIKVYTGNRIDIGANISSALITAIKESYISLIIFSEDYASSKWCLDELTEIIECKKLGQVVIPVFYNVDPSHVRKQSGSYKKAFVKHERDLNLNKDRVLKWKTVLAEAANLAGFHSQYCRMDNTLIEEIVKGVQKKLYHLYPNNEFKDLIGFHQDFAHMETLLALNSNDVRIIGIWGMGGIGKTALARALFAKYLSQFEGSCFLKDVREESEKHGLDHLHNKLLSKLLEEDNHEICTPRVVSSFFKRRLSNKRVFIVLDDVNSSKQLECLVEKDNLGLGSRVILTTRDKHMLTRGIDGYHKVEELSFEDSLQLFNLHAFEKSKPKCNTRSFH